MECLAIIKDKVMNKKNRRERRKRQKKKKQKQEEIERKAEERAKRNESRARKQKKNYVRKRKRGKSIEWQENGSSAHNVVQFKKSTRTCTFQVVNAVYAFKKDVELGIGIKWSQCAYTMWLHVDCILDCTTKRFFPYCT